MKTLALIPARAGSRGIPGKNTRDFCGKPLMQWAIEIGKATCDMTMVSTDGDEAARIAVDSGAVLRQVGAPIHTDNCPMLDVVRDALSVAPPEFDVVVLLQPTQPLRRPEHVQKALRVLGLTDADSVASVVEVPAHYSPEWALRIEDGRLYPVLTWLETSRFRPRMDHSPTCRQDCPPAYFRDGTIYMVRRHVVGAGSLYGNYCAPFVISPYESCNINTEEDWERAVRLKEKSNG